MLLLWLLRWRCMDSWVPKLSESSGLAHRGSEVVSGDTQLSCRWKASQSGNSTPSHCPQLEMLHTHTRYTQTNVSSVHFCLKTPNNPLRVYRCISKNFNSMKKINIFCNISESEAHILYRLITQSELFQAFIFFRNFDDYGLHIMKTQNSVSQKIWIIHQINK